MLRGVCGVLMLAACLFLSSGSLDWGMAWAYLGVSAFGIALTIALLIRRDPELLAERMRMHRGTKTWDKVLLPLIAIVFPLGLLIGAGLDRRFGWSPELPLALQIAALAVAALGFAVVVWAMLSNTFFASTARIQTERGHSVISDGPYRHVRHPGYAAVIVANLALPLALGSLWALIPAFLLAGLLVLRTALEDRMLMNELAGYSDYAERVPCRLAPSIW
jgi:protein-S-isoprenylcysteine O-methyltransferase Ste14